MKMIILYMVVNSATIPVAAYDSKEHCNFLATTLVDQGVEAYCETESKNQ